MIAAITRVAEPTVLEERAIRQIIAKHPHAMPRKSTGSYDLLLNQGPWTTDQ
jgi:hypothetical protein